MVRKVVFQSPIVSDTTITPWAQLTLNKFSLRKRPELSVYRLGRLQKWSTSQKGHADFWEAWLHLYLKIRWWLANTSRSFSMLNKSSISSISRLLKFKHYPELLPNRCSPSFLIQLSLSKPDSKWLASTSTLVFTMLVRKSTFVKAWVLSLPA